ncbi:hypothetical protein EBB07_26345 [Paenibacillaceae bacterium]|nr:hypothetical protein EBB07_26345 [Paenibacillaceae bacterium]
MPTWLLFAVAMSAAARFGITRCDVARRISMLRDMTLHNVLARWRTMRHDTTLHNVPGKTAHDAA